MFWYNPFLEKNNVCKTNAHENDYISVFGFVLDQALLNMLLHNNIFTVNHIPGYIDYISMIGTY